ILVTDSAGVAQDFSSIDTNRVREISSINLINQGKANIAGVTRGATTFPGSKPFNINGKSDFFVSQCINCDNKFQITASIIGNDSICQPDSIQIKASTGTDIQYQWYKIGKEIENQIDSVFYAKESSTFQVISNDGGCLDTSSNISVFVLPQ